MIRLGNYSVKISMAIFLSMIAICVMASASHAYSEKELFQVVSAVEVDTQPRDLVVTTLRINNPTTSHALYRIEMDMPDGWKVVSGDSPMDIKPNDGILRIVSFFVPGSATGGDYQVKFKLLPEEIDTPVADCIIDVSVKSTPQVNITSTGTVKTDALAGEIVPIEYKIQNLGNVKTSVKLQSKISKGGTAIINPDEVILDLDESAIVVLEFTPDQSITQVTDISIQLLANVTAETTGETVKTDSPFHRIKIFPRVTSDVDEYYRLPGKVKARVAGEKRQDTIHDYQLELNLSGPLNEDKTEWVELLYRGPDRNDKMMFYSQDEHIHATYKNEDFSIYVGDGHYGISPLIDLSRSGRGIRIDTRYDLFNLGTYYVRSFRTPFSEDIFAVSLDMEFDENNLLSFNALQSNVNESEYTTQEDRKIVGLRGQFSDGKHLNTDIELAKGGFSGIDGDDYAYRISARYREGDTEIYVRHLESGPAFSGYYRNMKMTEFSGSFPIGRGLKVQTNLRNQERNFMSLTTIQTSIREKFARIGATYNGYPGTSLTIDYISKDRKGEGDFLLFDSSNDYWQLGASQNIGNVTITGRVEVGNNEDRLIGDTVMHLGQHGSVTWRIDDKWSLTSFAGYNRGDSLNIYRGTSVRGGMNFRFNSDRKTIIASGVNLEVLRHLYRRVYIPFLFQHEFNNGDQLEIRARHSTSRRGENETSDTAVMVQYSIPFSLRLGHRSDISTITGYVRDLENENVGIPGVLVYTADQASLTDEHGKYTIKNLEPQTHVLSVNLKDDDFARLTVPSTPIEVDMSGGEIHFDIGVVTASTIAGQIKLHQDIAEARVRLLDMLVEIEFEDKSEFRLTGENGGFVFDKLVPGHYVLTIDSQTIPDGFEIEQTRYEIDLAPGERYEVVAYLEGKIVEIQIIKTGEELRLGSNQD